MFKVTLTARTKFDLKNIHNYIAADNPARANTYIKEIRAVIDNLGVFPFMGKQLDDSNDRRLIHGNYKIIYEVNEDVTEIYIKHVKNCAQNEQSYLK